MKIGKSERRERKLTRRRYGMRVSGRSVALLVRAQEKRDKERRRDANQVRALRDGILESDQRG